MGKILFAIASIIFYTNAFNIESAWTAEKKRVAILDFSAENAKKTSARAVRNIFEVSLYKTGSFDILERNQMENILKEQGFQMSGCTDTSCAVKIGRILSADMIVMGTLNRIGKYTTTVKFINIERGNIELADSETADTENDIGKSVKLLANRMATKITDIKKTPTIEIMDNDDEIQKETASSVLSDISFRISINGTYNAPIGEFKDIVKAGYGITANLYFENLFLQNLLLGIGSGYWNFTGGKKNIDTCEIFPVLLSTGYKLYIFDLIQITPVIGAGVSYNTITYDADGITVGSNNNYTEKSKTEPIIKGGLSIGYIFTKNFVVQISGEYNSIIESDGRLEFLIISAGIGFRF